MIRSKHNIRYAVGLHARPAAKFVKLAKSFESNISIRNLSRNGEEVNAKSLVKILKIACAQGQEVELCIEGVDEAIASQTLSEFLASSEE